MRFHHTPDRLPIRIMWLLSACLAMSGCSSALLELRDQNRQAEGRIRQKQLELSRLSEENQRLALEKNNLLKELDQKNLTLDELNDSLTRLKAANSKTRADTAAKRKKQARLAQSLDEYSNKINALKKNGQLSLEEKKNRSEALRQKIKDTVNQNLDLY
ncbi:MAG: hypothetical protein ACU841_07680 [Gammaproteobacteria bacterium]